MSSIHLTEVTLACPHTDGQIQITISSRGHITITTHGVIDQPRAHDTQPYRNLLGALLRHVGGDEQRLDSALRWLSDIATYAADNASIAEQHLHHLAGLRYDLAQQHQRAIAA